MESLIYKKGVVVSPTEHSLNGKVYLIEKGKALVVKNYNQPNQQLVETLISGDLLGAVEMFANMTLDVTYIMLEDVKVTAMSISEISTTHYNLIVRRLCRKVIEMNDKLSVLNDDAPVYIPYSESHTNADYIFPDWHTNKCEHTFAPETYSSYLMTKHYTCLYCDKDFQAKTTSISQLRLISGRLNCDLRRKYSDFEPLWYDIITCPHCYFTTYEDYFKRNIRINKMSVVKDLVTVKHNIFLDFREPRTLYKVFVRYHLAMACAKAFEDKIKVLSKVSVDLYRLCEDLDDKELVSETLRFAITNMKKYVDETILDPKREQVSLMILGSLFHKANDLDSAYHYLYMAKFIRDGNIIYHQIISAELEEVIRKRNELLQNTK